MAGVRFASRRGVAAGYILVIIYASLFPLSGWRVPDRSPFAFLFAALDHHHSGSDIVANVLAYVPTGALLVWASKRMASSSAALAVVAATAVSFSMETVQSFLPARNPSNLDLMTNALGAAVGAAFAWWWRSHHGIAVTLHSVRERDMLPGRVGNVGMAAVLLWVTSQWAPFVPSVDVSTLRAALAPLWHQLHGNARFDAVEFVSYAANVLAVAIVVRMVLTRALSVRRIAATVVCMGVILAKPLFVSRELSVEALAGAALGVVASYALRGRAIGWTAVGAIFVGFCAGELAPGSGSLQAFNWIPLAGQARDNLKGFASVAESVWPPVALAFVSAATGCDQRRAFWVGLAGILAVVLCFEWMQQWIPGRYGDVTPVLVSTLAWCVTFRYTRVTLKQPLAKFCNING